MPEDHNISEMFGDLSPEETGKGITRVETPEEVIEKLMDDPFENKALLAELNLGG